MGRSLQIARIAGIRILIHWTFLLLIGWVVYAEVKKGSDTNTILATIVFVLVLFACVVFHELGHSLTAKRYGIDTKKITLLPIGGVASLERIPEDPKQELWVALAGPAVNMVIALLLYPFIATGRVLSEPSLMNVATVEGFLFSLFWVNVFLVIFNALPAFPMDGGRVLRALLAMKLGRIRATSIASGIGQVMAVGFVLFGLVNSAPTLVLIGVFVFFGAQSENVVVQQLDLLKDYTVRSAMMTNFVTLSPGETVKDAADKLLSGSDQDLIVVENERAIGIMTRSRIIEALRENRLATSVMEVMITDFDTVQVNDRLTEVYSNVQRKPNSFFPVLENKKLMGVIDRTNINEFVMIRSALRY